MSSSVGDTLPIQARLHVSAPPTARPAFGRATRPYASPRLTRTDGARHGGKGAVDRLRPRRVREPEGWNAGTSADGDLELRGVASGESRRVGVLRPVPRAGALRRVDRSGTEPRRRPLR